MASHDPHIAGDPDRLSITRADLDLAAQDGLVTPAQAAALWGAWQERRPATQAPLAGERASPTFSFTHVLYYFGGMVAIASMSMFMSVSWNVLGASGLLAVTLADIAACVAGAAWLERRALTIPAGILATLAIVMVPLAAWCALNAAGLWPEGSTLTRFSDYHRDIDWRWLLLEAATLAAAIGMLRRHRHPFMMMPVAVTIWYVSMDGVNAIVARAGHDGAAWELYRQASLVFGLLTCLAALWVDLRGRSAGSSQDFAFWLYLFGALMAWSTLSLSDSNSEWGKLAYAAINVALVLFGAAIGRRIFTVLGAIGVAGYLGHVSSRLFHDSVLFPFALCLLGLGIVALGVWWQRHEAQLQHRLGRLMPLALRPLTLAGRR